MDAARRTGRGGGLCAALVREDRDRPQAVRPLAGDLLKSDALRVQNPGSIEEAREVVDAFVKYYNEVRLHSAIGYVTPLDKMNGREKQIWAERDQKLEAARERRQQRGIELRQAA